MAKTALQSRVCICEHYLAMSDVLHQFVPCYLEMFSHFRPDLCHQGDCASSILCECTSALAELKDDFRPSQFPELDRC